jgi:putative peptidoglycan lipid II flippase
MDQESERRVKALVRHGSALSLLTLVSRVLGLLREMTKAALLGTSPLSDAFSLAFMIPNLFRRLFAEGSISTAFIPTFKEYLPGDREKTREFLSCFFTFLTFFVTLAVMIGILVAPPVVSLFGSRGLEGAAGSGGFAEFDETVFLTRLMFPFLGFISLAAFFQGILNSLKIFTPSGFAPIALNVATILCAYGLSPFTANPARAMALGILIGGFLEAAIQLPFVLKEGQRFFFTGLVRAARNPGTRKVLRLIGPTIVGMAAYQLNDLVSSILAKHAGAGVVSSLQYSLRLQELILGIFAVSIGTVLLPDLAEYAKSGKWETFNERLLSAMNIIALITIPITFFFLTQGKGLIRLLFQSGSFTDESVGLTLSAFTFHIPGLYFIALNRILAPAFYAQSNSRSPTVAGLISFGVNIGLAAALAGPFRGAGIAAALSLASAVNTVFLLVFLKKNPSVAVSRAAKSALAYAGKIIAFSTVAAGPLLLLTPRLEGVFSGSNRLVSYGGPIVINGVVYGALGIGLLALTGDRHLRGIIRMFRRRQGKNP